MKIYKSWIVYFISSIILTTLFFAGINYYSDYYKVFGNNLHKIIKEPNLNVIKVNYILKNPQKYDSFIFGSSRVGFINPVLFTDGKYYNFSYPEGLPQEHFLIIKYLLSKNITIKNIVIGLDDFSYKLSPEKHYDSLYMNLHPDVSGKNKFLFYLKYLLIKPEILDKSKYIPMFFDIHNTGMIINEVKEKEFKDETNLKNHINNPYFKKAATYEEAYIPEAVKVIRKIVALCEQNNINLRIFINPLHKTTYLANDLNNFNRYKRELAQIMSYYDFSGVNKHTADNSKYYETSHYRPGIGDLIAKTLINREKNYDCNNFGVYVTRENIEEHQKCLERQYSF